ncbi:MAG: septum formation inhibitor Maf [Oscillospiraceae bacterium]|nr:septum formation inhibitor Maf [Oscillospiraceae bacterium]
MSKIILASGSPRRQELLKLVTDDFEICPVDADETLPAGMPVEMTAAFLADLKAKSCAKLFPDAIVIGCDTVVILEDEIMGKPKDREDAFRMLRKLSGEVHSVMTGVSLYYNTQTTVFTTETRVEFYPLSDAEINAYLDTGEPFDKAGAYGIQGKGSLLVRGIEGDYFNVVGLPVASLSRNLKQFETLIRKPKISLRPKI